MKMYNLIFSKDWPNRLTRHFIFWLAVFLYHLIRISFLYTPENIGKMASSILFGALIWGVLTNMIISYTVVYYLVPKFFINKKYLLFAVGILGLLLVALGIGVFQTLINRHMMGAVGFTQQRPYMFMRGTAIRILGNPPLICGLLLSLKTSKNWHLKQLENETLIKEKANAELQLLKAQIHPHFLFNTLNNIYSFTLTKSPQAVGLVQKLSDMLNYMITDCEQPLVPLEKEIQLLKDYIGLEKVRYGKRLNMEVKIDGDSENKLITPLLLIPFVENSFKHGASTMLENPWIRLNISIEQNELLFNLSNSKPSLVVSSNGKNGIGLINVQKRLKLLYPNQHFLEINERADFYQVSLKLPLHKTEVQKEIDFQEGYYEEHILKNVSVN